MNGFNIIIIIFLLLAVLGLMKETAATEKNINTMCGYLGGIPIGNFWSLAAECKFKDNK